MKRFKILALRPLILLALLALLAALVSPIVYPRCAKALDSISVSAPTPVTSPNPLTATCTFNATLGLAYFEYAVGHSSGGTDVQGWQDLGLRTSGFTITTSVATAGTYYISVHGRENPLTDPWGATVSSNAITYQAAADITPPTTPAVIDDGATTANRTQLHATWSASDPESGIAYYEYAIGTSAGGTDIVGFTNVGTQTSVTRTGLTLAPPPSTTVYYFTVMVYNGLTPPLSSQGSSDGITVAADTTPPSSPVVTDDGDFTTSATVCHVTWTAAQDAESGITEYRYAIGRTQGGTDILAYTSAGTALSATYTVPGTGLALGTVYYFSVVAVNGSALLSTPPGYSNGITVIDSSAPTPVTVTFPAAVTAAGGQLYVTDTTQLSFGWTGSTHPSDIREYYIGIGTGQPDLANVTAWVPNVVAWTNVHRETDHVATGLTLQNGATYYVGIRVRSMSNQETTCFSASVKVDTSVPAQPVVNDDGDFTSSTNELHASWTCEDQESGIAEVQCAIGTAPGGTDIFSWDRLDPPTTREHRWTNLSLRAGPTYYISIRVRNGASRPDSGWSQVGTTNGISFDASVPSTPVVTDEGEYTASTSELRFSWTATAQSAIVDYRYALGSSNNNTDVIQWTSNGTKTELRLTGLRLEAGKTYYLQVTARSASGQESIVGVSDGIVAGYAGSATGGSNAHGANPGSGGGSGVPSWVWVLVGVGVIVLVVVGLEIERRRSASNEEGPLM